MNVLTYKGPGFPPLRVELDKGRVRSLSWQRTRHARTAPLENTSDERQLLQQVEKDLEAYFAGRLKKFDWPLDWSTGTSFQRQVWQALKAIPYGETRSYQWIAQKIGRPRSVRAVGQANGANPFSLILPCHRVIRADGSLGGYAGGVAIKRNLLALENR